MTALVTAPMPDSTHFIECGGRVWDGARALTVPSDSERTCSTGGCMWWTIKDGRARGPGVVEICGVSKAPAGKGGPFAFVTCDWVTFEEVDGAWRIDKIVATSIS